MDTTPPTQEVLTTLAREMARNKVRREWRNAKESGGETRTRTGSAAVRQIVNGLMDLLANDLEAYAAGRPVRHGAALRHLKDAPISEVCLAVARAAVNGMTAEWVPGITMQSKLGAAAEDALLEAKWKKLDPFQAEAVRARLGHATDPLARRKARKAYLMGWARELEEHGEGWDERTTKTVGAAFLDYLVRLRMFVHHRALIGSTKRKWTNGVLLTETAAHWISHAAEFDAASAEVFLPTIDPPVPWTHPYGGGFHGRGSLDHPAVPRNQRPFWIVKNARKEHKALLLKADLSTVYAALNAAQGTGWRINGRVFEVFEELRRVGRGEAGLARADAAAKPMRPEAAEHIPEEHEKFLAARRDHYAGERKMVAKRMAEMRIFNTAHLFKDSERFHFVYALDFRGRAYAQSEYLSPQGRDLERGLLEFSEGDEMTSEGTWWMKIHLANTYGKDKESFDDRIRWADLNSAWFCRIAASPLDTVREWEKADAPWQFLAACFAWADYVNGERLCRLPVMLDGSCSGIQHSAALVRDQDAGSRVNLMPLASSEKPADIYGDVAERANAILAEKAKALDTQAYRWRYEWGVTRADTKASVMTLPYGGTEFGNRDKVRKSVEKQIRKGKKARPGWLSLEKNNREERGAAFKVLSDAVWQAMAEIIRAPIIVMDYFKDCAAVMRDRERELQRNARKAKTAEPNLRFAWTSPCGFPVLADYRVSKKRRTTLKDANGKSITFEYYAASGATDWNTAKDRAPPNVVHSLDASHLMRTLARARGTAGIDQVSIVHDAFGTTPAKVGAFARLLREEFAAMYSEDVLGETLGRMLGEAVAVSPEAPPLGALDLSHLCHARYMFA